MSVGGGEMFGFEHTVEHNTVIRKSEVDCVYGCGKI